jgi:Zn-dependent protease with chaperone function
MSGLGFLLALAFTAAVLSSMAALLVAAFAPLVRLMRLSSARRADLALLGGLVPGVAAVVGTGLAAVPALLSLFGLLSDHCLDHDHHGHLCPAHLANLPPWMAFVGAGVAAAAVASGTQRFVETMRQQRLVRAAALVGAQAQTDDGTAMVVLDGPPTLLHAANGFVIASGSLLAALTEGSRRAALAHEAAHVRRGDSRFLALLSLAAALAPPGFGSRMQRAFRQAAEEAADEEAACTVGGVDVAAAVVDVSRLRQRSLLEALPAIDGAELERRVHRLLALTPRPQQSGGFVVISALVAFAVVAAPFFDDVHHLVETALSHFEHGI